MRILAASTLFFVAAQSVSAEDCGPPPLKGPSVPENINGMSLDDLRTIRTAVTAYSEKVTVYITCMDQRGAKLLPFMTKEQQNRYNEDLDNMHEYRRDLQIKMNEAIRAFRRQARESQS